MPLGKYIFNQVSFTLYQTISNWLGYFSPAFLLATGGTHTQHSLPYHGVLYLAEFVLALVGGVLVLGKRRPLTAFPLVLIGLGFLPAALTRDQGHVLRALLALPGWLLLAALGLAALEQQKAKHFRLALSLLLVQSALFLTAYFAWYPRAFARDWQDGHQELAHFVAAREQAYAQIVMTKWYGEPQLFLAFYNRWDPAGYQLDNQPNLAYEAEGRMWLDQLPVYHLGKYTFKYLDWEQESRGGDTLYIGKFDDFPPSVTPLSTIFNSAGEPVFVIVEGDK